MNLPELRTLVEAAPEWVFIKGKTDEVSATKVIKELLDRVENLTKVLRAISDKHDREYDLEIDVWGYDAPLRY